MALFALADPHLGFGVDKPMDIFGMQWAGHADRLAQNWQSAVQPDDTVIIPGDISWAMNLSEVMPDLQFLDSLPGQKILTRGNHDYWWPSMSRLSQLRTESGFMSLRFIHNTCLAAGTDWLVCGTRGWLLPDDPDYGAGDEKIYLREIGRLSLSLEAAKRERLPGQRLLVSIHFPPFGRNGRSSRFTELMVSHAVDCCVFGHIHGILPDQDLAVPDDGIRYCLVAADHLGFIPQRLDL